MHSILTILQRGLNGAKVESQSRNGDDSQQHYECGRGENDREGSVLWIMRVRLGRERRGGNVATISPDTPRIIAILTVDAVIVCIGRLFIHVIIRAQLGTPSQRILVIVFGGVLQNRKAQFR